VFDNRFGHHLGVLEHHVERLLAIKQVAGQHVLDPRLARLDFPAGQAAHVTLLLAHLHLALSLVQDRRELPEILLDQRLRRVSTVFAFIWLLFPLFVVVELILDSIV
jgi:hypothetical protein